MARTVLLVEDEQELAAVVARELGQAGYRVLCAADGVEALAAAESERPDLVLLDWMLPRMDGLEVLRRIRQGSAVPVVMLTARGEEIDRVVGLELGADDYVTKPFSLRELVARVGAIFRRLDHVARVVAEDRGGGEAAEALHYGPLTLLTEGRQATLDGAPLDLSRTEFDLLHLLVRNPGRAFSRAYLLDAVWGVDYVTGDRSVDNAVLRLRRKLGALGDAIDTVWGVGYRLREDS
jgi:DNA-binding response OmpR family regulator